MINSESVNPVAWIAAREGCSVAELGRRIAEKSGESEIVVTGRLTRWKREGLPGKAEEDFRALGYQIVVQPIRTGES
ncbi:MAG: hypothetical protein AAGA75_03250 [Cyanobacteria bacterium P01_E01_bin.6]